MRKILLPLAFLGGFLTALIIGIKITGVFNMILISGVLMLQLAVLIGKLLYGAKELFYGHYPPLYHQPPPPYYPQQSSGGHSYSQASAYANSRADGLNQQPNFNSMQFPQSSGIQQQPQFNQGMIQPFNQPQQNLQPMSFGQQQSGPFMGISMQAPQQIQNSQFSQPFNQNHMQNLNPPSNLEPLENRIFSENSINNAPVAPMSPQEMTQMLSDAIDRMSAQTSPSFVTAKRRRSPNHFYYTYGKSS